MKTVILTHADCDGMCAGAIAQTRFPDSEVYFTKPVSFANDLKKTNADKIIICDIAITASHAKDIVDLFNEKIKTTEILYFDHHELPRSIKEKDINATHYKHHLNVSASEIIFKFFQKDIPLERVWVALYGAIGDYEDDTPFAIERMANWDRRSLFFEVSTLILGIKNRQFDSYDAKRNILKTMASGGNPSDVPGLVNSAKEAVSREFELYDYVKEHAIKKGKIGLILNMPRFGFRGPAALFSSNVTKTEIGLCVYERRNHIDITARKRSSDIHLNRLMEKSAIQLGGSGGGHPGAAGARIPFGKLDEFLKILNKLIG